MKLRNIFFLGVVVVFSAALTANDPRVPRSESDQVVRALRARGVPVEYMVAENEGHSLDRRENAIEFFSRVGVFLEKQLAAAK